MAITTAAEDKYARLMEIGAQVCDTEPCSCEGKRAKGLHAALDKALTEIAALGVVQADEGV